MKSMKKLSSFLGLFVMIGFLVIACEDAKKEKEDDPLPEVEAPSQIVSVKNAKEMYDNYSKYRVPIIQRFEDSGERNGEGQKMQNQRATAEQKTDSFDVARYGYYDLATLKQYIAFIEQEAARAKVTIANVRIYFSNYPDQERMNDKPVVHPKQNSFFLIPTVAEGDRDYAFFIRETNGEWGPVLLTDQLDEIGAESGMGLLDQEDKKAYASLLPKVNTTASYNGDQSLTMNEGSMVPPPHH